MELPTPLNQAHFLGRQADKLVKTGKFEEAVRLQDKIVEQLQLALEEATNNKVKESLELQVKFHNKQKDVIGQRQRRCEKFNKELANLKIKMEKANLAAADGLQDSIFRTFQETESLLQHLRVGTMDESSVPSDPRSGAKMPKDDKIIIEELQTANNHLRGMVEAMFAELETYKRENADLRAKVSDLEAEKIGKTMAGSNIPSMGLVVEQAGLQDSGHLPDLAPLEMPQFEFPLPKQE
eukprot:TRINITY_DN36229_c0_g1_i1.p1 TRINITY_DN36229_c0_g1~~TRINITY_DN36229_c0_g1_i1.p1  ORF type:complete len:238 (-),score=91.32 TRINITY_DN36229_c0_g1_i1:48-761(-)